MLERGIKDNRPDQTATHSQFRREEFLQEKKKEKPPFFFRVGRRLGWWQGDLPATVNPGHRIWFWGTSSQQLAERLVALLNDTLGQLYKENPRFGFVDAESIPSPKERGLIEVSIGSAIDGDTRGLLREMAEIRSVAIRRAKHQETYGTMKQIGTTEIPPLPGDSPIARKADEVPPPEVGEALAGEETGVTSDTSNVDPVDPPEDPKDFLGIAIDLMNRTVSRNDKTARFEGKTKAWMLLHAVYSSGDEGQSREDLIGQIWPTKVVNDNNLDQQKSIVNELLLPLRIEIAADRGIWKLAELEI